MSTRSQHSRRGIGYGKEARRLAQQQALGFGTDTRRLGEVSSTPSFNALNLTNSSSSGPRRSGVNKGHEEEEDIVHELSAQTESRPSSTNQVDDPPADAEPRRKCPWPVPHIIVDYKGVKYAWGRTDLRKVGEKGARTLFANAYCPYPEDYNDNSRTSLSAHGKLRMEFATKLRLAASLYYTHGSGDDDLVILQPVGWEEVLLNVKEIYVIPPSQRAPGDAQGS